MTKCIYCGEETIDEFSEIKTENKGILKVWLKYCEQCEEYTCEEIYPQKSKGEQ